MRQEVSSLRLYGYREAAFGSICPEKGCGVLRMLDRRLDRMTKYNYNIITYGLSFEWDERKSLQNRKKRGLSFEEAIMAFYDESALLIDDPDHSEEEDRFILLGFSPKHKLIVVCHTYRKNERSIRIISARKASRQEQKQYWQRRQK